MRVENQEHNGGRHQRFAEGFGMSDGELVRNIAYGIGVMLVCVTTVTLGGYALGHVLTSSGAAVPISGFSRPLTTVWDRENSQQEFKHDG